MICEVLSSPESFAAGRQEQMLNGRSIPTAGSSLNLKLDESNFILTELFSPLFKVKSDGTLYFEKVISEDEGRYTCKVTNGFGRPIEASAHIAVEYAARVSFTPTTQGRYSVMS